MKIYPLIQTLLFAFCVTCCGWIGSALAPLHAAVLVKDKMWPANTTLNVVFIDGNAAQKALVKRFAPLWLADSNLKFAFFDDWQHAPKLTHIRISFLSHNGSTLGNHGDLLSHEPTLMLAEIGTKDLPEDYARRYILHEFGHALGFEHEYRSPKWPYGMAAIEQQIIACYPRLESLGYLPSAAKEKCYEINAPLSVKATYSTIYDEFSIMNYPQVITLPDHSKKRIVAKNQLSVLDKLAMQRWYSTDRATN